LILDVEVLGVIKNPSDMELEMVQQYIGYEGLWTQAVKPESEKVDENDDLKLKGLHYNLNYNPATDDANSYKYLQPHCMNVADKLNNPYTDNRKYAVGKMAEINEKINEIMLKRFGKGLEVSKQSEKTQVTKNGRAKVWYVLRFLDGFVVDTNIAEIRTLMFDEANPDCEVFSYSPSDDDGKEEGNRQAIGAWYYCIPSLHYGAYAQIITTSGYAYGASGLSGTTTTTESSSSSNMANYYNAMNYYNYYNSYYNYYSPYYNYYDYNYYNYNYNVSEEEVTSTKTISTEILPYTPLVFTLYVEPYE
jgi:FKBP-type peptidyl-prolyl cis-trans isomerase